MTNKEFRDQLSQKMNEVKDHKLWNIAFRIAKDFGKEEITKYGDSTITTRKLDINVEDRKFIVSTTWDTLNFRISVYVDGAIVFNAIEINPEEEILTELVKLRLLYDIPTEFRKVALYVPQVIAYRSGAWMQFFNYLRFENQVLELARAEKERLKRAKEAEENRPLTHEEKKVAEEFGIQTEDLLPPSSAPRVHSTVPHHP